MWSGEDILVSVLMPVYNAEAYLKEAIESILNQTHKELELLALYDDSTDGTWEVLAEYAKKDKRLKILMFSHHGIAAALNTGLDSARGKYIARMDADDISLPNRLAVQTAYMEKHPEIGVCATRMRYFQNNDAKMHRNMHAAVDTEELKAGMLFECMIGHPTVMFRRDTMIRGNWKYHSDILCEDFDLWSRMIEMVPFAVIPEILLSYRYNVNSITKNRVNDVLLSSCEIVKRALERNLKVNTKKYKIIDFRGIHQVIRLEETIVENLKRQSMLLYEIYDNNQKIKYCSSEYLNNYIKMKWKFQFRNFGLMDKCCKECQEIDVTKPYSSFIDNFSMEFCMVAERHILHMSLQKKVVIYGAGIRGCKLMERWEELSTAGSLAWNLVGVADKQKTEIIYKGKRIVCMKLSELSALEYDYILISTDIYYDEIKAELILAKISEEKIYHSGVLNLLA